MKQNLVLLFLVLSTAGTAAAVGTPLPLADSDFYYGGAPDPGKVELGRLLFFNTARCPPSLTVMFNQHRPSLTIPVMTVSVVRTVAKQQT